MEIRTKTNGYELTKEHLEVLNKWEEMAQATMNIKYIEYFYYGSKLVMAKIKLKNGNYGNFNITEKRISFCGYTCEHEELALFGALTWNDECFSGKLFS